jgi:DNA-directed RNA polymerase specialized sigma24 family protein
VVLYSYTARATDVTRAGYAAGMGAHFPTTRWSLIAGTAAGSGARAAWSELAHAYRAPIEAYFRLRFGADQAEDLTQAFFAASMDGAWWARADAAQGGFRTYLRVLLSRFGARHAAERTGAAIDPDSLGGDEGPAAAYERQFAHVLVDRALARLDPQVTPAERVLLPYLLERGDAGDLKAIAVHQDVSGQTVRQRLRRLRLRLREILRDEVAVLAGGAQDVDEELRSIRAGFATDD